MMKKLHLSVRNRADEPGRLDSFKLTVCGLIGNYRRSGIKKQLEKVHTLFTSGNGTDEKKLKAVEYAERAFNAHPDFDTGNAETSIKADAIAILGLAILETSSSPCFAKAHELLRDLPRALPADSQRVLQNAIKSHRTSIGRAAALATYYKVNAAKLEWSERLVDYFISGCRTLDNNGQLALLSSFDAETRRDETFAGLLLSVTKKAAAGNELRVWHSSTPEPLRLRHSSEIERLRANEFTKGELVFLMEIAGRTGEPKNVPMITDIRHAFLSEMEIAGACRGAVDHIMSAHQQKPAGK